MVGDVPPAPDAGGGAAFEALADAFAAAYSDHTNDVPGSDVRSIAARAALLAAHAAAVQAADAAGYARAMRECSIAEMVDAGFTEADAAEDVDARMARAALIDTSAWTEADPPALVNGGPARDALDDGR